MPLQILLCDEVLMYFCFAYRSRLKFKFEFGSRGFEFIQKKSLRLTLLTHLTQLRLRDKA
jgi:hypothetical protein